MAGLVLDKKQIQKLVLFLDKVPFPGKQQKILPVYNAPNKKRNIYCSQYKKQLTMLIKQHFSIFQFQQSNGKQMYNNG